MLHLLFAVLTVVTVVVRTEVGEFVVEVDSDRAPITAANFLRYVDAGRDDGGQFHRTVTISMARYGPDTASSDFFVCIHDQPALDFGGARNPDGQGFAAFGRVVEGMDVVERIHRSANGDAQNLTPPVRIVSITRSTGSPVPPSCSPLVPSPPIPNP